MCNYLDPYCSNIKHFPKQNCTGFLLVDGNFIQEKEWKGSQRAGSCLFSPKRKCQITTPAQIDRGPQHKCLADGNFNINYWRWSSCQNSRRFLFVHTHPLFKRTKRRTDQAPKPKAALHHHFKRRDLKFMRDKTRIMFSKGFLFAFRAECTREIENDISSFVGENAQWEQFDL